jgi:hypothetical protein
MHGFAAAAAHTSARLITMSFDPPSGVGVALPCCLIGGFKTSNLTYSSLS